MNLSKNSLLAIAAGLAVLAILSWQKLPKPVMSQARPAVNVVPSAMLVLTERDPIPPNAVPAGQEVARASTPASAPQLGKSQQIDALVRTSDPTDAYAAYLLVHRCLFSRAHEAQALAVPGLAKRAGWETPVEACGDITPGQITSRLQWLNLAADAGVHRAAEDVNHEGPDGGWQYAPNSPLLDEWDRRSAAQLQAGIASGDSWSLGGSWAQAAGKIPWIKPNPSDALKYAVAWEEVVVAETGQPSQDGPAKIEALKASLPPDQAAAAIEAGRQIVIVARTSPFWHRP